MATLNLGILAHVDAGKTTLTERLLFEAGAIHRLGSVDSGTTQTDTLELERERGITIKSAVASFAIGDLTVNILDTPGHPDFIAEVERVLRVLDGAILVISAVEGVQPQTPLLFRALERLRVPTILFLNKLDRRGADPHRTLEQIAARLTPAAVALTVVSKPGGPDVRVRPLAASDSDEVVRLTEQLAERDDGVLGAFVAKGRVPWPRLLAGLREQSRAAAVYPILAGSAALGIGVGDLMAAIPELLPQAPDDAAASAAGRAFKIERTSSGERLAYVRLAAGRIRTRDVVSFGQQGEGRVTSVAVFRPGGPVVTTEARAGDIAKVGGLPGIRIGDRVGVVADAGVGDDPQFPPPGLESVVAPRDAGMRVRLRQALSELADQDPLIDVRQDDEVGELAVSLYGEVQKEVIGETLARVYGVEVTFSPTRTICVERLLGPGEALEVIRAATHTNISGKSSPESKNPFGATLGLRLEPGAIGSGLTFRVDVDVKLIPLQVFHTVEQFEGHLGRYVADALEEGIHGWRVVDCLVTLVDSGYWRTGTTSADFRRLTPLVVADAIRRAGVVVCEPMTAVRIESPADTGGGIVPLLLELGARILGQHTGQRTTIVALVQAGRVHEVQNRLPGLTGGEGVIETSFGGYVPVSSDPPPSRRRSRPNPFDRETYLASLGRKA
jgi:ribosomal protection tetracycline resistance protein